MKSFFLEGLSNPEEAREALSEFLPKQTDPWVLLTADEKDAVAYVNLEAEESEDFLGPFVIQVDLSGRHLDKIDFVILLLKSLQARLGGTLTDDT